ncbi:MAG TPA: universal stress protein [Syntrophorhabdaceae bacterium]|nr:universal stress protein [Syntrophorhabdaceae bacterium]
MHEIKRILVVSTSTSTCKKAIHYGVDLAKQLGAKLYVYHSDYDPFVLEGWGVPIPSLKTIREDYMRQLQVDRKVLNGIVDEEKTPDMEVEIVVSAEPLIKEVPKIVHEQKIDLVIMAAFREGRLEHFMFSSSLHDLVRTMPCSILLVKDRHAWEE